MKPSFEQVMELTRTVSGAAAFEDAECLALYNLCQNLQPLSVVVEIGCQIGRSSSIIAQMSKAIGFHAIHIDPYIDNAPYLVRWIEMMHSIGHPFTFLHMKSEESRKELFDLSFKNGGIDLLLIDGDHSEEGVWKDCRIAAQLVRSGGIMCAHDFGRGSLPDVYKVLSEYAVAPDWTQLAVHGTLGVWKRT